MNISDVRRVISGPLSAPTGIAPTGVAPTGTAQAADPLPMLEREWLVTNGRGGYASGTICGAATRRYHGLLIAAHTAPLGRLMMFNHLLEYLRLPSFRTVQFGGEDHVGGRLEMHGTEHLVEFRLD